MNEVAALPPPREDTLGIGGLSLHFASWGTPAAGRAALLIHGLTANSREFLTLGPALAERGFYAVAPDLRGRGLSAKPPYGYSLSIHAADLLTLCDALKLDQVALVGHSLGAAISMLMAAHYPQRVTRQVMVDRGAKVPEDTLQAIAATVSRLGVVYPSLDAFLGLMRQLPVIQWNALWEAYFRYDVEQLPDGTIRSRVPKYVIEEELFNPEQAMLEALPPLVQRPTLLLRAQLGTLGPDRGFVLAAEEAERLRGVMPDCQLVVVPGVNHYTIIESPVTHQAIFDFLG